MKDEKHKVAIMICKCLNAQSDSKAILYFAPSLPITLWDWMKCEKQYATNANPWLGSAHFFKIFVFYKCYDIFAFTTFMNPPPPLYGKIASKVWKIYFPYISPHFLGAAGSQISDLWLLLLSNSSLFSVLMSHLPLLLLHSVMIVQPRGVPKSYLTLKWQIFAPWGPICGSQRRAPDDGIVFLFRVLPKISDSTRSFRFTRCFGLPSTRWFPKLIRVGYRKKYRVAGRVRVPAWHCMCSETDFTQEKSHFHPTSIIPNSSFLFAVALSQNPWITVYRRCWGHEKCIFEAPHDEIKCDLGIKEYKFNGKK